MTRYDSLGDREGIGQGNTNPGHWLNRAYFTVAGTGGGIVYKNVALEKGIPFYISELTAEHIDALRALAHVPHGWARAEGEDLPIL